MELFTKSDIEVLISLMRTKEVTINMMETPTNNAIPKNEVSPLLEYH